MVDWMGRVHVVWHHEDHDKAFHYLGPADYVDDLILNHQIRNFAFLLVFRLLSISPNQLVMKTFFIHNVLPRSP